MSAARRPSTSRAWKSDGSARDFYSTSAVVVGPGLEPVDVELVQIAPGVYEAPLGEVEPGAYAVRVTQIKPGTSPLGRTIGLVAPTSAEYRLLGANEPFLAALRNATGGEEVLAPEDPWIRNLTATSRYTDLWPLLLILALLLWPLDIALRRVSVGRREFAAAGAWLTSAGGRRGRVGARTATNTSLLAARERTGTTTRSAMRADTAPPAAPTAATATTKTAASLAPPAGPDSPAATSTPAGKAATDPKPAPHAAQAPPAPSAASAKPAPSAAPEPEVDTMARLREAKRRARER